MCEVVQKPATMQSRLLAMRQAEAQVRSASIVIAQQRRASRDGKWEAEVREWERKEEQAMQFLSFDPRLEGDGGVLGLLLSAQFEAALVGKKVRSEQTFRTSVHASLQAV